MRIELPDPSLVVLIGASGSGKSTFARDHFLGTEVISSDFCRGLVADDENDQAASADAFAVVNFIAGRRLANARLTVIDATSVQVAARKSLLELAREHDLFAVAIVLDLPESVCLERNRARADRDFGDHVVRNQRKALQRSLKGLRREGFNRVWVLGSEDEVAAAEVVRVPLWTDRRGEHGPFDVIGDVHGCYDELVELLGKLGYDVAESGHVTAPAGRTAVFVGDYIDRGPDNVRVLKLVMGMAAEQTAICVPGNHDVKLARALGGRDVQVNHGLERSLAELETESEEFRAAVREFLSGLVSHVVLDDGALVVAHAGMPAAYQGRSSARVRDFALFGQTTGETDEFGLPVRVQWADDYRGKAVVVHGHVPVVAPEWVNDTIDIDTGCVFGGRLTALRWPERELVSVAARETYYEPIRPLGVVVAGPVVGGGGVVEGEAVAAPVTERVAGPIQPRDRFLLDIGDIAGRRLINTRLAGDVNLREDQAAPAIEQIGRFSIDPRWLIYLPPTMAPCATSSRAEVLEYPTEAFSGYRTDGVRRLICEEKHMGSRAVVVVCRDGETAVARFGVGAEGAGASASSGASAGAIYTRTGRAFFNDPGEQAAVLARIRAAADAIDLWKLLDSDWVVLDCELMPWSAKAIELIREQYAAVGAAAGAGLGASILALEQAAGRGLDVDDTLARQRRRLADVERYVAAYRRYVWPVNSLADLRLAPFQLLAAESGVFVDRDHDWHLAIADRLHQADPDFFAETKRVHLDLDDADSEAAAVSWWEALTAAGGEGMVVKPLDGVVTAKHGNAKDKNGIAQPGVKCRGPEYLRIIYGPEYTEPEQIARLRQRNLARKRSLAIREYALGIEALERFVARAPLYRVHECVFGVLAMESDPVDPRL